MKRLLAILLVLFITGCTTEISVTQDVRQTPPTQDNLLIPTVFEDTASCSVAADASYDDPEGFTISYPSGWDFSEYARNAILLRKESSNIVVGPHEQHPNTMQERYENVILAHENEDAYAVLPATIDGREGAFITYQYLEPAPGAQGEYPLNQRTITTLNLILIDGATLVRISGSTYNPEELCEMRAIMETTTFQ